MLWVITQSKKSLINVKEVTVKGKNIEGVIGRSFFTEWSRTLGRYNSNERATEILNELYKEMEEGNNLPITFKMPEK